MSHKTGQVTIQDVARAAGVSVTTVSRVLNEKTDVSAATYAKVRSVIDELGYTSGLAARSLRSSRTNVIGLIVPDLYQAFNVEVARGVYSAVTEHDLDLLVYSGRQQEDARRAKWEQEQVALLNGSITDGIVVAAPYAVRFRTDYPLVAVDPHKQGGRLPHRLVHQPHRRHGCHGVSDRIGTSSNRLHQWPHRPDQYLAQKPGIL